MPQTTTIKSLPVAFAMMKAMQAAGVDGARTIAAPSAKRSPNCSKAAWTMLIDDYLARKIHEELAGADQAVEIV